MSDAVNKALDVLGLSEDIQLFSKQISGILFASKENASFQDVISRVLLPRIKQMTAGESEFNIFSLLFDINKFNDPKIANVNLVSLQVYDTFLVYSMSVDITDTSIDLSVVDSDMGAAYNTPRLIYSRMDLYVDTINSTEFLVVDAGVAKRISSEDEFDVDATPDPEPALIPVGMVAGFWPSLPSAIELLEPYNNIPAGTVLTLNPDIGTYLSEYGGISAVLYHLVSSSSLPVFPSPDTLFVPLIDEDQEDDEDPESDIPEDTFDDDDHDDSIGDFFKKLK